MFSCVVEIGPSSCGGLLLVDNIGERLHCRFLEEWLTWRTFLKQNHLIICSSIVGLHPFLESFYSQAWDNLVIVLIYLRAGRGLLEWAFLWLWPSLEDRSCCDSLVSLEGEEQQDFRCSLTSNEDLISKITLTIAKWVLVSNVLFNFSLVNILFNWDLGGLYELWFG